MGCNLKLPDGFRFDPTDEEMLLYLQRRLDDLNDSRLAFIPNIRMQDHDPSEFPWLCTVKGKDGIMYFFAEWDRYGKRVDRQVKKDSMKARWKEWSSETIKSSDGTQIGTRKNLTFQVDGSLTQWHMEEYRLCSRPEHEHSKVSICRVSKKCGQARGATKIDAKETHSYDLHISQSAAETDNSNGQEEGQPYWCNFCSNWCPHDETLHRLLRNLCNRLHDQDQTLLALLNYINERDDQDQTLLALLNYINERECPLPNVRHLGPQTNNSRGKKEDGQSCTSDTGNGPERETLDMDSGDWKGSYEASEALIKASNFTVPINGLQQVDNRDTGNCQSANDTVLDTNYRTDMVDNLNPRNCQSAEDGELLDMPDRFSRLGTVLQDAPICSNAAEESVGNPDGPNWFFSLDDDSQNLQNPPEENVHNRDTGNCQIADDITMDDIIMDLNDLIEIRSRPLSPVDNTDTGNCQIADDTIIIMDIDGSFFFETL